MCTSMYMCVGMHECVWIPQVNVRCLFSHSLPYYLCVYIWANTEAKGSLSTVFVFWRQGLSLNLQFSTQLAWLVIKSLESTCLHHNHHHPSSVATDVYCDMCLLKIHIEILASEVTVIGKHLGR